MIAKPRSKTELSPGEIERINRSKRDQSQGFLLRAIRQCVEASKADLDGIYIPRSKVTNVEFGLVFMPDGLMGVRNIQQLMDHPRYSQGRTKIPKFWGENFHDKKLPMDRVNLAFDTLSLHLEYDAGTFMIGISKLDRRQGKLYEHSFLCLLVMPQHYMGSWGLTDPVTSGTVMCSEESLAKKVWV